MRGCLSLVSSGTGRRESPRGGIMGPWQERARYDPVRTRRPHFPLSVPARGPDPFHPPRPRSSHLQHNASRLRQVISAEAFVAHFGEPAPHPKGARRSIFGMEDELKVAPKGIDKTHKCVGSSSTYSPITIEAGVLHVATETSIY